MTKLIETPDPPGYREILAAMISNNDRTNDTDSINSIDGRYICGGKMPTTKRLTVPAGFRLVEIRIFPWVDE